MAKRKIGDIIWLAMQYAKQDRITLIDAYNGNLQEKAVRSAVRDIKDIERVQLMLFGTTRSRLDAAIANATPVELNSKNFRKLLDRFIE